MEDVVILIQRNLVDRRVLPCNLSQALVVAEEKDFVPNDRSTDGAAELVLPQLRLGQVLTELIRISVEGIVLKEFVSRTVKRVGAGLGNDIDNRAAGAAYLGGVVVRLNADFADCFD